jgi:hypothetical protein
LRGRGGSWGGLGREVVGRKRGDIHEENEQEKEKFLYYEETNGLFIPPNLQYLVRTDLRRESTVFLNQHIYDGTAYYLSSR